MTTIWLVAVALIPFLADGQQPGKVTRIGYLDDSSAAGSAEVLNAFRKQMTQLNWIEGKNLTIEYRYAEGQGLIGALNSQINWYASNLAWSWSTS